jgi:hypothetical protein
MAAPLSTIVRKPFLTKSERGMQFMGWLANFFRSPAGVDAPSHSTDFHDLDDSPVPLKPVAADLRIARELIKSAAVQTALAYGIPGRWLTFEVVTIADDEKAYFQLQVVMNHWDEYLAAHCYAFERAVVKRIRDESMEVGRAVRAVLWRTAADAGCPYDDLPEAQAWSADAVKKRGMVRDRINRELYATSTPASGAAVSGKQPTTLPVSASEAERAGNSTQPVSQDSPLEDSAFGDTRPSSFNGFAATQPYAPLMSDIFEHPKK